MKPGYTLSLLILALISAIALIGCSEEPLPPPPEPRAELPERTYPLNENWTVAADRVVQGDKSAVALSAERIESAYFRRERIWSLREDISALPVFTAEGAPLYEALYNMALEEALENVRSDGAFMAGREWNGVWTRDISYAIHLSLAGILPESSRISLMAKVNEYGEVIQDTGTGGSWPISTDRVVWAIAAWELYLATGDAEWLGEARSILGNTLMRDLSVALDPASGLLYGETSFLDWREQTYPKWMEPKDIFESKAFGTNLLFARALEIYARMSSAAGDGDRSTEFSALAARQYGRIADEFPLSGGLYPLYLYPPIQGSIPSDKTGTLSNSLAAIFSADPDSPAALLSTGSISASLPTVPFGIPTIEPQQPRISPYHNAGIWPFVEAYYGLAAASEGNLPAFEFAFQAMSRNAALFTSHMENLVYDNGHSEGTQINSERQLWSVAGYLGMVYRGLFGIGFDEIGIRFSPMVPDIFPGETISLENYRVRDTVLNMEIRGSGSVIAAMTVNGEEHNPFSPIVWTPGSFDIVIEMEAGPETGGRRIIPTGITAAHELQLEEIPSDSRGGTRVSFRSLSAGVESRVWDGSIFRTLGSVEGDEKEIIAAPGQIISMAAFSEAPDGRQIRSNLSRWVYDQSSAISVMANPGEGSEAGGDGGYAEINGVPGEVLSFPVVIPENRRYYICFEYANGNGPINTDNKAAIRTLFVQDRSLGTVVLPQRGSGEWGNYGLSSGMILDLPAGNAKIELRYLPENRNMNGEINQARIRRLLLIPLE
jgi:glycogen debranching enzyme